MPDFQYQPPTGPLSGSEFERQTTRFFQQVQGAADTAQSTAIVAQNTANEALERAAASNLVDGKTTQADAGGAITVKDVAIGGNLGDLASARGQIGDSKLVTAVSNLNDYVTQGNWFFSNAAASGENSPKPNIGGFLSVLFNTQYIFQIYNQITGNRIWLRYGNTSGVWASWISYITSSTIGDGLRVTNGIISVPEYEGATASAAGTSGLVPPAAAGQANYVLCGDGEWRDIATLVAAAQARLAESAKAEEGTS